ncbi:MAG TPA: hypothetical protein PKM88_01935 [bacterium]|nr:hypothetical protein [bacterium]
MAAADGGGIGLMGEAERTVTGTYGWPAHGVRVANELLDAAWRRGEEVVAFTKEYRLGTGVCWRLTFRPCPAPPRCRLLAAHGRRRADNDARFAGARVLTALPMKILGVTTGYYYLLADAADCRYAPETNNQR